MAMCESCGMPLDDPLSVSMFDQRYCIHCQDQTTSLLAPYEQVRQESIDAAIRLLGKTRAEAEKMADEMLPTLPRWRR